jgi:hypothetical protein
VTDAYERVRAPVAGMSVDSHMVGEKEGVGRDDDRLLANSECAWLLAGRFGDRDRREQAKNFKPLRFSCRPCCNLCEDGRDVPRL